MTDCMFSYKTPLLTLLSVFALSSTGCSTIAPERSAASELMGKNIQEAYKKIWQTLYDLDRALSKLKS